MSKLSRMLRAAAVSLLAACVAAPVAAGDLVFGVGANTLYDDNVYGTSADEVGDFALQFVPKVRFLESTGSFSADVRYDPIYEYFVDESELRGWDHTARAAFDYRPSADTTISLEDDLQRYRGARLLTTPDGGGTPIELSARDELLRNVAQLSVEHAFSAVQKLSVSAYHALWDFTESSRTDQWNSGVALEYLQTLRPAFRLGGSLSISHARFEDEPGRSSADTTYYSGALVLEWQPTDRLNASLAAGPAYVDTRAEETDPPPGVVVIGPIPEVGSDSSFTTFASASLAWEIERGELSFSYERRDDIEGALGFSAVTDTVSLRARYELIRNLTGELSLIWEGRDGEVEYVAFQTILPGFVLPVVVAGDTTLDSLSASLSATYYFTETTKLAGWVTWRSQDDRSEVPSGYSDLDRTQVFIGVTHQFAAIRW